MPELPEVEQVRISLEPYVLEQKIEDVRILLPRMIVHPSPEGFRKGLRDAVVTAVLRRGKYLSLMLKGGERLMVHLRMTGAFLAVKKGESLPNDQKGMGATCHCHQGSHSKCLAPSWNNVPQLPGCRRKNGG